MRLALIALTVLCVSLPARAADDPQAVYAKLHVASLAGDIETMIKHATAARRAEVSALPGKAETAKLMAAMLPRTYSVTRATVSPDGKTAELETTGMHALVGPPKPMYGIVKLVREGGEWKADRWEWSTDKPAASAALAQAPAAAPPAAAPADAPARAPRAAGPTAEEKAEMKRKAEAERIAAEKRRRAELEALCVIKPVMSDDEIAKCRAASQM